MQAILILAHKNLQQVIQLSGLLRSTFEVYVHIDKKSNVTTEQLASFNRLGVHIYQKIDVKWGGWSIAAATQLLYKEALKNPDITYFHLISGEDWITVSPNKILDYFNQTDLIYLQSELSQTTIKSGEKVINWTKFYYNYDYVKFSRRSFIGKLYHRVLYWSQNLLQIDKFKKYKFNLSIYQGGVWSSLPRYAVTYLLETYESDERYEKIFKTSFCPDEMWMQTLLENSPYQNKMVRHHHHYINWRVKYNNYPGVLDCEDYDKIDTSQHLFMRKIDLTISKALLEQLNMD